MRQARYRHAAPTGHLQQAVNRHRAASLLEAGQQFQLEYLLRRRIVQLLRFGISVEVRQVGAGDDQGLFTAPEAINDFRDLDHRGLTDSQRNQRKIPQHGLQKR